MVPDARGRRVLWGMGAGCVPAVVGALTLGSIERPLLPDGLGVWAGFALIVAVSLLFAFAGLRRGPRADAPAPESRTDGKLDALLGDPRVEQGADPVLLRAGEAWPGALDAGSPLGLGFLDLTEEEDRFGRFATEAVLRPIEEDELGGRSGDGG